MEIRAYVVARAHDIVNLFLDDVGFFLLRVELVAARVVLTVTRQHRVVAVGGLVIVGIVRRKVRGDLVGKGPVEGAAHAGAAIALGDLGVTAGTGSGINVTGGCEVGDGTSIRHGLGVFGLRTGGTKKVESAQNGGYAQRRDEHESTSRTG